MANEIRVVKEQLVPKDPTESPPISTTGTLSGGAVGAILIFCINRWVDESSTKQLLLYLIPSASALIGAASLWLGAQFSRMWRRRQEQTQAEHFKREKEIFRQEAYAAVERATRLLEEAEADEKSTPQYLKTLREKHEEAKLKLHDLETQELR